MASFKTHAVAITDRDPTGRVGDIINQVVTNANLADVAKETGLVRHMSFLNPKIKEKTNEHVLGTVVEALLGAIHEDSGKDPEAVRRAMHMMGLTLPAWYTVKSKLSRPELQKARAELDRSDLKKFKFELRQLDLRSRPNQIDLQQAKSESHRIVVQKQEPAKKSSRRGRRRLETLHKPQEKVDRGLSEHKDLDEGSSVIDIRLQRSKPQAIKTSRRLMRLQYGAITRAHTKRSAKTTVQNMPFSQMPTQSRHISETKTQIGRVSRLQRHTKSALSLQLLSSPAAAGGN